MSTQNVINIITCVITVLALVFTLYLWLLDHLSEEETEFIKGKTNLLRKLNECKDRINATKELDILLVNAKMVNDLLEVALHYRFWTRGQKKDDYNRICNFYDDTKYLISTIRRYNELNNEAKKQTTIVDIRTISDEQVKEISDEYLDGLHYIIEFFGSW